jgi:hypothetical protein
VNRRFIALLVMLAIGLQGPILAYAGTVTAKTMPAGCTGHTLGHSSDNDSSCCPQGIAAGFCCAGGIVLTGIPSTQVTRHAERPHLSPPASGPVAFASERPTPLIRPPIA